MLGTILASCKMKLFTGKFFQLLEVF